LLSPKSIGIVILNIVGVKHFTTEQIKCACRYLHTKNITSGYVTASHDKDFRTLIMNKIAECH